MSWRELAVAGVGVQRLEQHVGREDVVAHRREHLVGRVGQARTDARLLEEERDRRSAGRAR